MTDDLDDRHPGERDVWTGSPRRYPIFNRLDAVLVPMSLLWCAIAFRLAVFNPLIPPVKLAVGVIAALLGQYLVVGRLVTRQLHLRSARYRITDRRVVITSRVFGRQYTRSVSLTDLAPPVVANRSGRSGTITFGAPTLLDGLKGVREHGFTMHRTTAPPVLVEVDEPERVRDTISSAQAALGA